MAHRVPYVARVDRIHRRAYPDAVFWHSLAPDKLEPPHSVPVSFKTQYCSHRSAPAMSFLVMRILQHLHTRTLNPSVWIPVRLHTFQSISFQSVQFFSHPISESTSQTVPICLISQYWYAECLAICYGVSPYRYAVCLGIDYEISPYRYAEYLGIDHQITPYRYAVYSDIVHHIPPQWYAVYFGNVYHVSPYWYVNACINKRLPIAAYHLADTHTRCQKIPAR